MLTKLEDSQVPACGTLMDAMRSLEKTGLEIALILDKDGRLYGTLTDGDIRRALIKGAALDSRVEPHAQRHFTSVGLQAGRAEVLDLMQARALQQIPALDEHGRLVGLHLLHDIIGGVVRQNWAIIMAGGKGMRLRPITEHLPKPMIMVAGRPILERLVLHVVSIGVRRIFLSVNYLGHMVEEHFGNGAAFGCQIDYLREETPLGTGGALSLLPEKPTHPLLTLNGDVVTQADFGAMLDFHARSDCLATLGAREYTHTVPFGCLEIEGSRVRCFDEKPMLRRLVNTGMYVLEPSLLERVPSGVNFPITNLFEDCLQRGEHLGAFEVEEDWIDVGQREQLRLAREGVA
ncbi:MAG: nucleotidyltransferase family protein [Roseimicrobium sp.]